MKMENGEWRMAGSGLCHPPFSSPIGVHMCPICG
jgi:hypothetical protein